MKMYSEYRMTTPETKQGNSLPISATLLEDVVEEVAHASDLSLLFTGTETISLETRAIVALLEISLLVSHKIRAWFELVVGTDCLDTTLTILDYMLIAVLSDKLFRILSEGISNVHIDTTKCWQEFHRYKYL